MKQSANSRLSIQWSERKQTKSTTLQRKLAFFLKQSYYFEGKTKKKGLFSLLVRA